MSDELRAPRLQPSASYSFTMRLHLPQQGGAFARVAHAIADAEALLGAIDLVRVESDEVVRDVTVACVDSAHAEAVVRAVRELDGVRVDSVSDRTFLMHKGGKIEVNAKLPLKTRDDLSMAYTPGVGRVSMAIHEDPAKGWALTIRGNTVAVVSDGTAMLGLSGPGAVTPAGIRTMAPDAIVFAMANPVPEVQPEAVRGDVAIIATGPSDYPNQINNVLAFPGVFKGALEVRARTINEDMKLAAAHAIAGVIPDHELHPDYIIPSVFNRRVAASVAEAVANAAAASGVARRARG